MFGKILHANDGSGHALRALPFALAIARQNGSKLQMVCAQEVPYLPELVEAIREPVETAACCFPSPLCC
jgi:nucleotide-binding universal stress UspA family protein